MLTTMARTKASGVPKRVPNRVRSAATNIRSTPEWRMWLQEFADHKRKDLVDLIDEALLAYARQEQFKIPPKR